MRLSFKHLFCLLIIVICSFIFINESKAQQDRFVTIEQKIRTLETDAPGLKEKVDISVSGVSLQEFIRALAKSNNLNINVDPTLNINLVNNFTGETVSNILLFLARQYDLDFQFIGSIISISKYNSPVTPVVEKPAKKIEISYDAQKDFLSFNLKNDTLGSVAKTITQLSGKNIIIAPGISNNMVSGYIQNMAFDNALDKMTFANNLKMTKTDDGVYVIETNTETPTATASKTKKSKSGKSVSSDDNENMSLTVEIDSLGQKVVSVEGTNIPIVDIIKAASKELGVSYFLFADPQGNTTVKLSKIHYEELLTYLLKGTTFTFKKDNEIYLIGDRNQEALRVTKTIQLQYRSADIILDVIPADMKKGVEAKKFPELNSIILSGSTPAINEIESFIRQLDQVVPVILIEVLIVDVNKSITSSTGIKMGLRKTPADNTGETNSLFPTFNYTFNATAVNSLISALSGSGIVNLGKVTNEFYVSMNFLEGQGLVKVHSTPKLATLNGHTASMTIGKTDYYVEQTNNIIGTQNPQSQTITQYKPVNADMAINISPVVSGDEQVTLDIEVKISDFTDKIQLGAPPGSANQTFKSMIRVKNEEMVILGGLEKQKTSDSGEGVPFLSRIPVIKWFFSSRIKAKSKGKLNVFIKPTIIY